MPKCDNFYAIEMEFASPDILEGVKEKVALKSLNKWRRCLHHTILASLIVALLAQIAQLAQKYAEGPTYVTQEILEQNAASFPALTVCPEVINRD